MKNPKKALALLLAALMLASLTFAGCSGGGNGKDDETAADPGVSAQDAVPGTPEDLADEPEGNGRSNVKDSLPDDLDFGGATLHFLTRGGDRDTEMEFKAE